MGIIQKKGRNESLSVYLEASFFPLWLYHFRMGPVTECPPSILNKCGHHGKKDASNLFSFEGNGCKAYG